MPKSKPKKRVSPRVVIGNQSVNKSGDPKIFDKMFKDEAPTEGYELLSVDAHVGRHGTLVLQWSARGIGFGEVIMWLENKQVKIDSEGMEKEFCDHLVKTVVEELQKEEQKKKDTSFKRITSNFVRHFYDNVSW